MIPLGLLKKLFRFEDEEIPPEQRAQRELNRTRAKKITQYVLDNPTTYVLSALTVTVQTPSIHGLQFEPSESDPSESSGFLTIEMDSIFLIADGQHRSAAINQAIESNPELRDETISVTIFADIGVKRRQQIFSDLNLYTSKPSNSLGILYNHRDKVSETVRKVIQEVKIFRNLTDMERTSLPKKSAKLFTLNAVHEAIAYMLKHLEIADETRQVKVIADYWSAVTKQIPAWELVMDRRMSAGELRLESLCSHAIAVVALGRIGVWLIKADAVTERLSKLSSLDWARSNPVWQAEGIITSTGRIQKNSASIAALADYIQSNLS